MPIPSNGRIFMASEDYVDNFYTDALYPTAVSANSMLYSSSSNIVEEVSLSGDGILIVTDGVPSVSSAIQVVNDVVVMPTQPLFIAYLSGSSNNCTGDSTVFTMPFDSTVIDLNSNFNTTTHAFVAPVDGIYYFSLSWKLNQVTPLASSITAQAVVTGTSAGTYVLVTAGSGIGDIANAIAQTNSTYIQMTSGDSVTFQVKVSGITKTVDLVGGSASQTSISGKLV